MSYLNAPPPESCPKCSRDGPKVDGDNWTCPGCGLEQWHHDGEWVVLGPREELEGGDFM